MPFVVQFLLIIASVLPGLLGIRAIVSGEVGLFPGKHVKGVMARVVGVAALILAVALFGFALFVYPLLLGATPSR